MSNIEIHRIEYVVEGTIIKRPSRHIKSPYVADVMIGGEEYLAHCQIGLCGMIVPGSIVFMTKNQTITKTDYKVHAVVVKNEFEVKTVLRY